MKKILSVLLMISMCGLVGCGKEMVAVKPDIVCNVSKIMDDISTLEDEDCNKIYGGKVICADGEIVNKGTDADDATVVTMSFLRGKQHNWAIRAYVKDEHDKDKLKKMNKGDAVTIQGRVAQSGLTIPRNGDRVVELLDARIVAK